LWLAPEAELSWLLAELRRAFDFSIDLQLPDGTLRPFSIPCEFKTGHSWGVASEDFPSGVSKIKAPVPSAETAAAFAEWRARNEQSVR
jgi:hypothetical protein